MSYDVALYFRHTAFPLQDWMNVIREFNPEEHEVIKSKHRKNTVAEWTVTCGESSLWLELQDIRAERYFKPAQAQWKVLITHTGHQPQDVWFQFAVPYHALALMDNLVFYDLQHDVYTESQKEYLKFVEARLSQFGLSKMVKHHLLDADGKVIF